jgi:hypothetical protein
LKAFSSLRGGLATKQSRPVIAGLDPAIHLLRKTLSKMMDARVKPAHDEVIALPSLSSAGALRRPVGTQ